MIVGQATKITAIRTSFASSEAATRWMKRIGCGTPLLRLSPAVSESRVILDRVKSVIDLTEFLSNTLYERAYVGPVAFGSDASRKAFAPHEIVDVTIAHIGPG